MNKMSGKQSDFSLVREENSRIVIGYGQQKVTGKDLYEWYEVYLNKNQTPQLTLKMVKDAILDDINAQTDAKILSGFVWNNISVWLSAENQRNFSEAHRMGMVPVTFKLWELPDCTAVYHTFETMSELDDFYRHACAYINQCLQEGWQKKDGFDFGDYEKELSRF
jgi:hypothetical protein